MGSQSKLVGGRFQPSVRFGFIAYRFLKNICARCRWSVHRHERAGFATDRSSSPAGEPAAIARPDLAARGIFRWWGSALRQVGSTLRRKLFDALPAGNGMAFILIQHLDPTHASMMVELLAGHTPMTVQQAADGMPLEREHVYVIPPGVYLSIRDGALRLSKPQRAPWRAHAVRLLPAFAGGRARRSRDLRGPLGNRRRWQPRAEGDQGEGRARHRAGARRRPGTTACRAARS